MMTEQTLITVDSRQLVLDDPPPLDKQPAAVYLAGLSESSRRVMGTAVCTIAGMISGQQDIQHVAWHQLGFQHVKLLRTLLAERYAPATANRHLAALRGVLKSARKLHLIDVNRCADLLDECHTVKGETVPKGRSLAAGEIMALLNVCAADQTVAAARDAAIIACLYGCGLRRSELVKLNLDSFNPESGGLVVKGKGNKQRTVYVVDGARLALDDWLNLRGTEPGALFWQIRKGGHLVRRQLTPQAVMHILAQRGRQAGVNDFSPHDLRRTLAGDLLDAGEDIAIVQRILGHSDPATTARYDRRPEAAKQRAQRKIHIPYHRRTTLAA